MAVAASLVLLAGLAWGWLITTPMDAGRDMEGMAMPVEPWSAAYLLPAFAMWTIMMVAMMLPSAAPMILLHARIDRSETARARLLHTWFFMGAYLLVWTGFSASAAATQALLTDTGTISTAALSLGGRTLTAAVLILAGLYELTATKRRCLEHCQSPLVFLMRYSRPGSWEAFRLGIRHGVYCLGCCWALMLLLFAGGVMNLAWVAVLGIVVVGEKFAPPAWQLHRWLAALLILGGLAFLWRSQPPVDRAPALLLQEGIGLAEMPAAEKSRMR